jgi:SAM-dependent methyltransferase
MQICTKQSKEDMNQAGQLFEKNFLNHDMEAQVRTCDDYELAGIIKDVLGSSQPILEAGCGSGRWCVWLDRRGIASDGVDWSASLCERAQKIAPQRRFVACDMTATPFDDSSYGSILALGSVEHDPAGPQKALNEFYRLLRPGGIALITVPYGGSIRRMVRQIKRWMALVREKTRRSSTASSPDSASTGGQRLAVALRQVRMKWCPHLIRNGNKWNFFEYEFTRRQMRAFLKQSGFEMQKEWAAFKDEGVLHTFAPLAGRWDDASSSVRLNPLGKALRAALPVSLIGHMLCFLVEKPSRTAMAAESASLSPHGTMD